jgi:hypothetical protein
MAARASNRFATFAHAMRRTRPNCAKEDEQRWLDVTNQVFV